MLKLLLRVALYGLYAILLVSVLTVSSYLSFSAFVRRGAVLAPDVVGLPMAEAATMLSEVGLELRHQQAGDRFDPKVPAGHVVQQNPRAASPMKEGAQVKVTLSRGYQLVPMPDVAGQSVRAAQAALAASGLPIATAVSVYWPESVPGTVVQQSPAAGEEVDPASEVELFVSIGDPHATFVMPDLVYRHADEVREYFEARGFRFGSVKFEPYEGIEEGVILRHTPLAGHPLRRGDAITLVVATRAET